MGAFGTLWKTLKYPVGAYGRDRQHFSVSDGADHEGGGIYSGAAYTWKISV